MLTDLLTRRFMAIQIIARVLGYSGPVLWIYSLAHFIINISGSISFA